MREGQAAVCHAFAAPRGPSSRGREEGPPRTSDSPFAVFLACGRRSEASQSDSGLAALRAASPQPGGSERRSPQTPQRGFGKGRNPNQSENAIVPWSQPVQVTFAALSGSSVVVYPAGRCVQTRFASSVPPVTQGGGGLDW